jgi:hypothetical protein
VTASLRHGHQFEHVSVRIAEIDAATAVPVVELAVFEAPWRAAVSDFLSLDAAQDGVEFTVADMESEMMALEFVVVVEQQRQRFVDFDRREMVAAAALEPEYAGEKSRPGDLIPSRNDGVVERDRHCGASL